jgi:hypothetical protein
MLSSSNERETMMRKSPQTAEILDAIAHNTRSLALSQQYAADADRLRIRQHAPRLVFPVYLFLN